MNALQHVSGYLSTHHAGNWSCAAISLEASLNGLVDLIQAVVFIYHGIFKAPPNENKDLHLFRKIISRIKSDRHSQFKNAKREITEAGRDILNASIYGIGAVNPIAGVVIPITIITTKLFQSYKDDTAVEKKDG